MSTSPIQVIPSIDGDQEKRPALLVRFELALRWFGANLRVGFAVDRGGR